MTEKKQTAIVSNGMDGRTFIRGPLGIWFFPLLNAFLQFIYALRRLNYGPIDGGNKKIYQLIRDENGRIVEIVEVEL